MAMQRLSLPARGGWLARRRSRARVGWGLSLTTYVDPTPALRADPPRRRGGMMGHPYRKTSIQFSNSLHRSRDAFCIRVIRPMRTRKKSEGARDAGGPTDPRASMRRRTEAERRSRPRPPSGRGSAVSPPSLQRPARGVWRLSSAWPPVAEWFLPTALDPDSAWPFGTELRRCRQRAR